MNPKLSVRSTVNTPLTTATSPYTSTTSTARWNSSFAIVLAFPFEQAGTAVEAPDAIDVGHELVCVRERAYELDLEIPSGLADADTVFLTEPF